MSDLLIGRLIKELRKKNNMTMVDFAKKLKYPSRHYLR